MEDPLEEKLRRCCVRVPGKGSGVFVAPGTILTCAHVVGYDRARGDEIVVRTGSGADVERTARVVDIRIDPDEDVALLFIRDWADHDCVVLGDDIVRGDSVIAMGFPYYDGRVYCDSLSLVYESTTRGVADGSEHVLHKFKDALVVGGFSGGPVLNLRTGRTIGILSDTRGRQAALGGWAITATFARAQFPLLRTTEAARERAWDDALAAHRAMQRALVDQLAGGDERLPGSTAIANFIDSYLGGPDMPEPFGGRDDELLRLDGWLSSETEPPYLLLTAAAGRGKSALLVRWLSRLRAAQREHAAIDIVFVPISIRYGLNTEQAVFRAIVARLRRIFGERSATAPTDADGWRDALGDLLGREPPAGRNIIIVIDALDEAAGWDVGPALFPTKPGSRIRVVVSARYTAERDGAGWRESLGWQRSDVATDLQLDDLTRDGVAGVVAQTPELAATDRAALVDELYRLTGGDPLTLSLYLKDLLAATVRGGSFSPAELAALPPGLDGYFERWWEDQRKLWRARAGELERQTTVVLNLLATALAPLPRRALLDVLALAGTEMSGERLDEALASLSRIVLHDRTTSSYAIGHPKLAAYQYGKLMRDGENERYEAVFVQLGRRALQAWSTDTIPVPPPYSYGVKYYSTHLERSGADAAAFQELVTRRWEAVWQAIDDEDDGYASDVRKAWAKARLADDAAIEAGRPAPFLAAEVRCAYDLARRNDFTATILPLMLVNLVRHGLWTQNHACSYAASVLDPTRRAEALAAIAPLLSPQRVGVLEEFANELMGDRRHDTDYALQQLLAPACVRLAELSLMDRCARLLDATPAGAARARARIAVAMAGSADPAAEILGGFEDLAAEDWADRFAAMSDLLHAPAALARLDPRTRAAIVALIDEWSAGYLDGHIDDADQRLEFVVAFLDERDAARVVRDTFGRITNERSLRRTAVVREIAPFLADSLIGEALAFSAAAPEQIDGTYSILALLPRLDADQRAPWLERVLGSVPELMRMPSDNDRHDVMKLLCRIDETDVVVRLLQDFGERWSLFGYVVAVAPYLTEVDVRHFLARDEEMWRDDDVRAVLCERLSAFGRAQCREALIRLADGGLADEARCSSLCLRLGENENGAIDLGLLADLLLYAEPQTLLDTIHHLLEVTPVVRGVDFQILLGAFGADSRALEALGVMTPRLAAADLARGNALNALESVITDVPGSTEKDLAVAAYFSRLAAIGQGSAAFDFAMQLSTSRFQTPLLAAIIGLAESADDALVRRLFDAAKTMTRPIEKLTALAALSTRIGVEPWLALYRAERPRMNDDIRRNDAPFFALMLRYLPVPVRDELLAELVPLADDLEHANLGTFGDRFVRLVPFFSLETTRSVLAQVGAFPAPSERNAARRACAARLAELGALSEALYAAEWISQIAEIGATLAEIVAYAGDDDVIKVLGQALWPSNNDRIDRGPIWAAIAPRWRRIHPAAALSILRTWLERAAFMPRRNVLKDIRGIGRALIRCGGRAALLDVLALTDEVADASL